jgi:hypothetical protein
LGCWSESGARARAAKAARARGASVGPRARAMRADVLASAEAQTTTSAMHRNKLRACAIVRRFKSC